MWLDSCHGIIDLSLLMCHTFMFSYRASFLAGILGTAATNPIDVVKVLILLSETS